MPTARRSIRMTACGFLPRNRGTPCVESGLQKRKRKAITTVSPTKASGRFAILRTRGRFFGLDRKSTRLNSSHGYISYAVFCLKKKISMLNITRTDSVYRFRLEPPVSTVSGPLESHVELTTEQQERLRRALQSASQYMQSSASN